METTALDSIHQKRIYGLAYQYMANREDAEDVVQEVMLRLWNHSSGLTGEEQEAWIGRVTRNVCLDALRRRKSYRSAVGTRAGELAVQNAPDLLQHLGIEEALSRLAEPYRTVIRLRYFKGLSCKAIGRELGMLPSTVRVYLSRGQKRMRVLLE